MTATATKQMMTQIEKALCMFHLSYIVESPNRLNIRFSVCHIEKLDIEVFSWLLNELITKKEECKKVIIYCRRVDDCATLYQSFAIALRADGYSPSGECDLRNALFGMFHAKIVDADKETLLKSFCKPDGKCWVM